MLKFIKGKHSLKGKVLLVCGISSGYVPTFALDNLIVLNHFQRIAFLQSKFLEPSVGYLPKDIQAGALGLPGELYVNGDVAILQFRSVLRFGRKKDFAKQIAKLVRSQEIADVIILASLPFTIRPDRQIESLHKNIYYKLKGVQGQSIMIDRCIQLGLVRSLQELKDEDEQQETLLSQAGLSSALLKELDSVLVLLMFSQQLEDKPTGEHFSTQIYKIVDKKELSIVK